MLKAVCFDAFGTLIQRTTPREPYGALREHMTSREIMTSKQSIGMLLANVGKLHLRDQAIAEFDIDFAGCRPYPDTLQAINLVREHGLKIAVCSNLAPLYSRVVSDLVPYSDAWVYSYRVGAIKPEPEIYQEVCNQLTLAPNEILFIGDSKKNDYECPIAFGMQAAWLNRTAGKTLLDVLSTVTLRYQ